jgi:hypothetical protein
MFTAGTPLPVAVPAVIQPQGTLASAVDTTSAASSTLSVSPVNVGGILALAIETKFSGSAITVASVSGGGVTTWVQDLAHATADGVHYAYLFHGVITAAGAATITVDFSATGKVSSTINAQEFYSATPSVTWTTDVTGVQDPNVAGTTYTYPSLRSAAADEMYWGYLAVASSATAGSGTGWTYEQDANGNWDAYNPNVGAAGTVASTTQSSSTSQLWFTVGVLISAKS